MLGRATAPPAGTGASTVAVCTSSSWSFHAASIFSKRLTSAGRARSFCRSCSASAALAEEDEDDEDDEIEVDSR